MAHPTACSATSASAAATNSSTELLSSYQACLPHLSVKTSELAKAIDYYKQAFDADFFPYYSATGQLQDDAPRRLLLGHFKFGSSQFLISEVPEKNQDDENSARLPADAMVISANVVLHVVTDDVEGAVEKAKAAGAEVLHDPDLTSGVRFTMLADPVGYVWAFTGTVLEVEQQQQVAAAKEVESTAESALQVESGAGPEDTLI